jgi:hypothetical protein
MHHDDIRHKLSEYIDGSITPEEKREIDAHLETCSSCGDALKELQKTVAHIKSVDDVEPPAWLARKIMAHVRSEAEEKNGLLPGVLHPARSAAPAMSKARQEQEEPAAHRQQEKKSLLRRLLAPVFLNVPLRAVAVLFLAVTAFYIYRTIEPARVATTSEEQYTVAQKEPAAPELKSSPPEPSADAPARREKKHSIPQQAPAKIQQAPGYKALDMKLEYEQPAAPKPQERAAALQKMEKQPTSTGDAAAMNRELTDKAAAPSMKQERVPMMLGESAQTTNENATRQRADERKGASLAARSKAPEVQQATGVVRRDDVQERVEEYFTSHDLPQSRIKELKYTIMKVSALSVELRDFDQDLRKALSSCKNGYVVDAELDKNRTLYFYCAEDAGIKFLGKYNRQNGAWTRTK